MPSRTAAEAGGEITSAEEAKLEAEAIEMFKEQGVTYTEPDRDAFRKALAGIAEQYEGTDWPEGFIDKIKAIQ